MTFKATKDPSSVLDYQLDWSAWLAGNDTISTSTWSASGITIDSDANTSTSATVWLSGGVAGNKYRVTNRIVTAGGRTAERTIEVTCAER